MTTEHRMYNNAKIYASYVTEKSNVNVDKYTKGNPTDQRKENVQILKDHVVSDKNHTGVFSGYLHTLFREKDHSKWESEDIEGDTGKKYKVHDHDKLFDYLRNHKSELLNEAKKSTYLKRTILYYDLSTNVYKSGNRYYMSPKTISDYTALSAFNYLKYSDAAQDDLKLIMDNNKKTIRFYGNKVHKHGSKKERADKILSEQEDVNADAPKMQDSHSTEKDVYNYYHLNSTDSFSNINDFKARVGQSRIGNNNYDCGQYSQAASYINNEYAVAYLDSLLCGYNIAYNRYVSYCSGLKSEKVKGKPLTDKQIASRKAKAKKLVDVWKTAVLTELDASSTKKNTSTMTCLRIDEVGGTYSKARKSLSLANFGSYAVGTYAIHQYVPLMPDFFGDDNKKKNNKSVSQSFYGVTGGLRAEKIDEKSPWYDAITYTPVTVDGKQHWGRSGVKTISDALDIGNVYDRIYKAAKKNSKGKPEYSADDNDWAYITWSQNVIDNNKIKDSKNFSGVAKRARAGQMLYDRIDNIHKYNYGYAHTSPVALYRVAKEPVTPKHSAFELRVHSEKANGSANGAVLTDNNYPDGVGKLKNDNGIEIHDTAETAGGTKKDKGITVTKAGANIMQDRISLKIDSPNTEGIFDKLQGEDVKIVVKYEIGTEKDASLDPNQISDRHKENMKLVDMSKAQDKENILADAEKKKNYTYLDKTKLKIDSLNSKSDDKREDFTPTPESASTDKPKPKDGEDDNAIYYEPASENNDSQVSASDSTSVYYGKDSAWLDAKDAKNNTYKNLVWQQGISEMADTGFSFSVPDEKKWEHYYRICIKAKIGVFKPGDDSSVYDQPYYDDRESHEEGWSEGYIYTNPVYVTYHVTRSRPDNPNEFYGNSGTINNYDSAVQHGYAEFKEGSVYNETFEAMAGVPTTRTMYFATGGEEFIINLQAVYDDYVAKKGTGTTTTAAGNVDHNEYKTKRLYTVHFKGIDCEYKEGDTFKGGVGPSSDAPAETFAADANDNKDGSSAVREHNSAVQPKSSGGLSDYNVTTQSHNTATRFYAEWTGTIANNTPRPGNNFDGFNPGNPGSPCRGLGFDVGNGASRKMENAETNWNVNDYNNALRSATDWAKDMEKTSRDAENGTVWRWDDSDGAKRIYHCGKAQVTVSLRDGAMQYGNNCGASPNLGAKSGTYGSDCYSDEKLESDEKDVLGAGWSWQNGQNGEGGGHVNACGGHFNVCSSTDKDHVHTEHDPGYYNPGKNAEDGPNATISYTITVTFTDGNITSKFLDGNSSNGQVECSEAPASSEIPAHAMCGSCCEHVLPDLYDKWQQKLRYDTVRFSAAAVWKIDDGYAGDTGYDPDNEMAAIKKKTPGSGIGADNLGIEDQAEDDPSWAPGTQDWDGVSAITGNEAQFVRSKIVRYDPNIFYNIAQSETSRAGRLRYSLQAGQDDNVYWEEMGPEGRSNGYTRSNLCDGRTGTGWDSQTYASFSSRIGGSNYTPNVSVTPVHVQASGHKKSFCRGCLYNNPDSFSNDMYHHNNPKASTTDYVSWNGLKDGNKTTIGPDAQTKTAMTSNTADAVDKQS